MKALGGRLKRRHDAHTTETSSCIKSATQWKARFGKKSAFLKKKNDNEDGL